MLILSFGMYLGAMVCTSVYAYRLAQLRITKRNAWMVRPIA